MRCPVADPSVPVGDERTGRGTACGALWQTATLRLGTRAPQADAPTIGGGEFGVEEIGQGRHPRVGAGLALPLSATAEHRDGQPGRASPAPTQDDHDRSWTASPGGAWRECLLGDVLTLQRGFDLPNRHRRDGTVPIVSSSGITGFHSEARVIGPGVITGRYGTLGEVFYVDREFWPLNTTLYVRDFKGNDPLFLSYFLRTLDLSSQNTAGAVPGLNRKALH